MIEIVINYDPLKDEYKIYEPTTSTLIVTKNLSEALVNLSHFLSTSGMIQGDILSYPDISYHIDSYTMKAMIESNVNLMKKLQSGPSGFLKSSQKFGGSTITPRSGDFKKSSNSFSNKGMSDFSGNSGFKTASKKFGRK